MRKKISVQIAAIMPEEDALKNALCHTGEACRLILPVSRHPGFQNRFSHCTAANGRGEFQSDYFHPAVCVSNIGSFIQLLKKGFLLHLFIPLLHELRYN